MSVEKFLLEYLKSSALHSQDIMPGQLSSYVFLFVSVLHDTKVESVLVRVWSKCCADCLPTQV